LYRYSTVMYCKECQRYLQPPKHWIRADLESKELLTFCIKRIKVGQLYNAPGSRGWVKLKAADPRLEKASAWCHVNPGAYEVMKSWWFLQAFACSKRKTPRAATPRA
jgi:hypothetical protein